MKGQYTIKENKLIGTLSLCDLKVWANEFNDSCITIKNRTGVLTLKQILCTRKMPKYSYANSWTRIKVYILNGTETTEKFSDIAKVLIAKGFTKGFSLVKFDCEEIIDAGGEIINRNEAVLTYDTDEYLRKEDAYYCETNNEWYESDDELIYIDGNYYHCDDPDVSYCDSCDEYFIGTTTEVHTNGGIEHWCDSCVDSDAFCCDDCGEWWSNDDANYIDRPDSTVCPDCYNDNYCYCEECGRTVHIDYWNGYYECCDDCAEEKNEYVKNYHWHHNHDYTNKFTLFMPKGKMVHLGNTDEVRTCGLELEVSKDSLDGQKETIEQLLDLPLKENEIFFEHDGSLDKGGFEIITGVHTFESLKNMPWDSILRILSKNGYRSHNGGLCGLHIHIGRKFFGKTENAQNNAIGKIYAFYNLFWKDIVKVSRRERFTFCDNPYEELEPETLYSFIKNNAEHTYKLLLKKAENKEGTHGLALNNSNTDTFELRLGRGTLKYESFMAWVDFTLTIAKNARKVSTRKLDDCDAWLNGISKETAMYIKSKGAFTGSTVIQNLTNGGIAVCA